MKNRTSPFHFVPEKYWHVQELEKLYGWLGIHCVRNTTKVIIVALCSSFVLSLGLLNAEMETDSTKLWVPPDSVEYQNAVNTKSLFSDSGSGSNIFIQGKKNNGANIVDELHVMHVFHLVQEIMEINVNGKTYTDLCVKRYIDGPCASWNVFALWDYNPTAIQSAVTNGLFLPTIHALGQKTSLDPFFGDIVYNSNHDFMGAQAMVMTFSIENSLQTYEWETKLIALILKEKKAIESEIISMRCVDDEIQRLVSGDSVLFGVSMSAILLYLSVSLGKIDIIESRFLLAWSGIVTVMLSLAAAFGTTSALGIPLHSIVLLVSFILVGVGVDDMIVIVHYFDSHASILNLEERMRQTMVHGGSAVTLTSLTAIFAFLSGVFIPLPGVQSFCANALVAFLWTFVLSITLFPALLVMDFRRVQQRRHFLFIWKILPEVPSQEPSSLTSKVAVAGPDVPIVHNLNVSLDGTADVQTCATTVNIAPIQNIKKSRVKKSGSKNQYRYHDALCRVILHPVGKVAVLSISLATSLAVVFVAMDHVEVGLAISDVIPDDSYVTRALDLSRNHWPATIAQWTVVAEEVDVSSTAVRDKLQIFFTWYENQTYALPPFGGAEKTWLDNYLQFMALRGIPSTDFNDHLNEFLHAFPQFTSHVKCTYRNDICTSISASRYKIGTLNPDNTQERFAIMIIIQKKIIALELENKVYITGEDLMFARVDNEIPRMTLEALISTVFTIFITLLLFTEPGISLVISTMVANIDLALYSTLAWWDIKLNAVSFMNFVMSVGLCVDYCVHIGHAYSKAEGSGNLRVKNAIRAMGSSVFQGGFTTFVGVMMLSIASSTAFRTFFKMLLCTVVLGVYHGLVVMPVILSIVGDTLIGNTKAIKPRYSLAGFTHWMNRKSIKIENSEPLENVQKFKAVIQN